MTVFEDTLRVRGEIRDGMWGGIVIEAHERDALADAIEALRACQATRVQGTDQWTVNGDLGRVFDALARLDAA